MTYTPGGGGASAFLGLTDTPGSYSGQAAKVAAVNAGATALEFVAAGGGGGGVDYSATETDTGLKWTDAATVYQKVITKAALTDGGTTTFAHGITGLAQVIDMTGAVQRSNGDQLPMMFASGSANIGIQLTVDATNLNFTSGSFWNGAGSEDLTDLVVILLYTKT